MLMARERFFASKGEDLEKRERPPGSVSAAAAGPSAGTSRRSRRPLCSAARFRPRCAGPSFQGLVQRVRDTYEVYGLRSGATANPSLPAEAPRDALAGLGEAEHPSRPACPPVPSALPQALLPRERMVESRGSADKLMAPIGRLGLTCRSQPDSSTARACSRAGTRGGSCSETQT